MLIRKIYFEARNSLLEHENKLTSPKEFSASKCDVGKWILSKSWVFVKLIGNFMEFFGSLLRIFWEFIGNFWEEFFERNFLGKVFGKKFRGGFFRRTIFGRINFGRKFLGGIICLHY